MTKSDTRRFAMALVAIVAVGAALRLFGLGSRPFWLDEAHTANFSRLPLTDLWSFDRPFDVVNPPGFIVLTKIWSQVSRSDEWIRLLSALAGVATIPMVYAVGLRMGSRRAGLFGAAFIALSGFHVRYSQEARAYALITLAAVVALWSVAQLVSEPDGDLAGPVRRRARPTRTAGQGLRRPVTWTDIAWIGYAVSVGFALHLHNTSFGIPLAANLAVAVWWLTTSPKPPRFLRNWIGANLAALLLWSPWLPGFLAQLDLVQANFWVTSPTLESVTRDVGVLFDAYTGLLVPAMNRLWFHAVVVVTVLATMWWGSRAVDRRHRLILWSFVLVLPAFELVFSIRQPVFLSRTLLWILLGCAVALGLAVDRAFPVSARHTTNRGDGEGQDARPVRIGWALAASAILALGAFGALGYHTSYEKTAWDEAAALVAEQGGPDDVVLVLAGNTLVAFDHYFDGYDLDIPRYSIPWRIPERASTGSVLTSDDVDRIVDLVGPHQRTWLVLNSVGNIEGGDTLASTLANRFTMIDRRTMTDLEVVVYE